MIANDDHDPDKGNKPQTRLARVNSLSYSWMANLSLPSFNLTSNWTQRRPNQPASKPACRSELNRTERQPEVKCKFYAVLPNLDSSLDSSVQPRYSSPFCSPLSFVSCLAPFFIHSFMNLILVKIKSFFELTRSLATNEKTWSYEERRQKRV